jgi:hypothetical protein
VVEVACVVAVGGRLDGVSIVDDGGRTGLRIVVDPLGRSGNRATVCWVVVVLVARADAGVAFRWIGTVSSVRGGSADLDLFPSAIS